MGNFRFLITSTILSPKDCWLKCLCYRCIIVLYHCVVSLCCVIVLYHCTIVWLLSLVWPTCRRAQRTPRLSIDSTGGLTMKSKTSPLWLKRCHQHDQRNQILHRLQNDITHVLQVWLTQFFPILTPFWKPPQPATGRWKTWAWRRPTSRSCFQGWKSSGETSLLSGFFDILLVMAVLLGFHRAEQAKLNSGLDVCLGKADTLGISFAASSSYSSLTSSRF